jgi:hypothetical protein
LGRHVRRCRSWQEHFKEGRDFARRIISLFGDARANRIESEDVVALVRSAVSVAALIAAGAVVAGCAWHSSAAVGVLAGPQAPDEDRCRFVTAAEVARVVGVAAVKPVEFQGGCSYLLDPTDVMPSIDPNATTLPHLPPSIDFQLPTEVIGWDEPLKENERHVPALVEQSLWVDDDDIDLHQLLVRIPRGFVRIVITHPDSPQHLRSNNLEELATQIFEIARPRLP